MKRRFLLCLPVVFMLAASLSGCQDGSTPSEENETPVSGTVKLTVWGAEEDE